jgi:prepilin-type N-terminal cleavage/methylation domain-containing protein
MGKEKRINGFTLIEVLFAILLIGIGISALIGANIAFTRANGFGANLSTAEFLIEQVRELTVQMNYTNLFSLDDNSYSPPIDADGTALSDFDAFTQEITVQNVSNTNFENVVADGTTDFVRVTVTVLLKSEQISSANWIRAKY